MNIFPERVKMIGTIRALKNDDDKMHPPLIRTAGENNVHLQSAVISAEDFSFYQ